MNTMTDLPTASTSLASLQVLLVDDDPFTHELLGGMLRKLGVSRIATANDGAAGLAALKGAGAPDLVICDLNMPGKDGFQLMEEMAASGYAGAVVLLSGMQPRVLNSAALMARFHQLNVLEVVAKPVSRDALARLLGRVGQKRA